METALKPGEKEEEIIEELNTKKIRKSAIEYFKEYCDASSIQGLNYLIRDISIQERCWWILVIFLSFLGGGYMIYELCIKWVQTPVLVSLGTKEVGIFQIPFPAVTICPESKISKVCLDYSETIRKINREELDTISEKEKEYFNLMGLMCDADNHHDVLNITEMPDLDNYYNFLNECKSVDLDISLCYWLGKMVDCDQILNPILTEEGLCYTFNMFDLEDIYSKENVAFYPKPKYNTIPTWDIEEGYPPGPFKHNYPRRIYLSGADNALIVVFFTNKLDLNYSCRDFTLQGMRVTLHMPSRIPQPSEIFFPIGKNRLTTAAVIPALTKTTADVKAYDPHKRNCYFSKERNLKFFKVYSQMNCNFECFTNYTIQECGCTQFHMPRDNETHVCSFENQTCIYDSRISYTKSRLKYAGTDRRTSDCDCLPLCNDLTYNVETSTGIWDWKSTDDPLMDELKDFIDWYDASAVKVFFKNSQILPLEKSELYGITDFISNAGGILGLFTGFSLFSIVEIVYFLSVRLIQNYRLHGHWAGIKNGDSDSNAS